MILFVLAVLASGSTDQAFCERQMKRFDNNERAMAVSYDFHKMLLDIEDDLYSKTGDRRHSKAALEHQKKIVIVWNEGAEEADRILSLMIAADCDLPDHEASPHTYSKTKERRVSNSVVSLD